VPETRLERGVFILGVLAIAALGFVVAHLWHNTHGTASDRRTATLVTLTRTSPATRRTASTTATTAAGPTTDVQATTAATGPAATLLTTGAVSLVLRARVGTWLEVRSGSSTGSVLFSGTLPAASAKTFRAATLWVRFGAAGNLAAQVDGKAVRLPSGTYDATFDGVHGFRPQRG
jgi:RodZ C-terminal domain